VPAGKVRDSISGARVRAGVEAGMGLTVALAVVSDGAAAGFGVATTRGSESVDCREPPRLLDGFLTITVNGEVAQ